MMRNKRIKLKRKDKKIIQFIAEHGPSWYYELYMIHKIASNKTVNETLKRLEGSLLEVKRKEDPRGPHVMGRKRRYYGLTFRGLHYALYSGFIDYKDLKNVVKRHSIDVPEIPKEQYDYLLKISSFVHRFDPSLRFYRLFFVVLGRKRLRDVVHVVFERYPKLLFGEKEMTDMLGKIPAVYYAFLDSFKINPLTSEFRYLCELIGSALMVFGEKERDFSDEEATNLIGGDGLTLLRMVMKYRQNVPSETELLQSLPPQKRREYARKLNQI